MKRYEPYHPKIEANNEAFRKRLQKFHRSEEGKQLRKQIQETRKKLFAAYRDIALSHWQQLGNDASTGWGCVPEDSYSSPRKPEDCAFELANKLTDYLLEDPQYALGAK